MPKTRIVRLRGTGAHYKYLFCIRVVNYVISIYQSAVDCLDRDVSPKGDIVSSGRLNSLAHLTPRHQLNGAPTSSGIAHQLWQPLDTPLYLYHLRAYLQWVWCLDPSQLELRAIAFDHRVNLSFSCEPPVSVAGGNSYNDCHSAQEVNFTSTKILRYLDGEIGDCCRNYDDSYF